MHPKGTINCAGYRVLTSMEEYLELLNTSLPGQSKEENEKERWENLREEKSSQRNVPKGKLNSIKLSKSYWLTGFTSVMLA